MEAALGTTLLVKDRSQIVRDVTWRLRYSERDWFLEIKGNGFDFRLSGYLWGEEKANWLVSFAGSGGIYGKESMSVNGPMSVNGKAEWLYDPKISDHIGMDFYNTVKFGEKSVWGWVIGSEIIIGGTIGAGGAIAAAVITTGGVGALVAVPIGLAGALTGATAMVSASGSVQTMLESDKPPAPPEPPKRPPVPQKEENLVPGKDRIIIAISKEGQVSGIGPDGGLAISGSVGSDAGTGVITAR